MDGLGIETYDDKRWVAIFVGLMSGYKANLQNRTLYTSFGCAPDRSAIYPSQNRRRPESLDDEVDTERQLPDELGNRRDGLHRGPALDDVEHDGNSRGRDQRTQCPCVK
jgi:hypothetical protein